MPVHGPIPKRSEDRRRANKPATEVTRAPAAARVVAPRANPKWHPVAARLFRSLKASGQSRFYEPSDWATAYLIAESLSLDLKPQFIGFAQTSRDTTEAEYGVIPLKGASLSAYLKALGNLLATEGDRRRVSMELQRGTVVDADDEASVAQMADYRAHLGA